jgi:hypothetical protein
VSVRAAGHLDRVQRGRERLHLAQGGLGLAGRVGEAEVLLECVVPVRVLAGQVEVGVVPGDPAGRPGQQAVVQDVPVVAGRVLLGGEVRADPELPRRHDFVRCVIAAVERHLVGDQPPGHGQVRAEPAHHLSGEPGLPPDQPHVAVEVPARPPRRIPVLARHVPDDERGDRAHVLAGVLVEEIGKPRRHVLVDHVGLRHEVRPVEERPGHGQPVHAQHPQFLADHVRVVAAPHKRAPGPGPEVDPEPAGRLPTGDDPGGVPAYATPLPSPDGLAAADEA